MFTYKCNCAGRLNLIGIIVQAMYSIIGIVLLFSLFDDYRMRWLIAIVSCVVCLVLGYVSRIVFSCVAVITENQYRQIINCKSDE